MTPPRPHRNVESRQSRKKKKYLVVEGLVEENIISSLNLGVKVIQNKETNLKN